jgi:hypothetical protein
MYTCDGCWQVTLLLSGAVTVTGSVADPALTAGMTRMKSWSLALATVTVNVSVPVLDGVEQG